MDSSDEQEAAVAMLSFLFGPPKRQVAAAPAKRVRTKVTRPNHSDDDDNYSIPPLDKQRECDRRLHITLDGVRIPAKNSSRLVFNSRTVARAMATHFVYELENIIGMPPCPPASPDSTEPDYQMEVISAKLVLDEPVPDKPAVLAPPEPEPKPKASPLLPTDASDEMIIVEGASIQVPITVTIIDLPDDDEPLPPPMAEAPDCNTVNYFNAGMWNYRIHESLASPFYANVVRPTVLALLERIPDTTFRARLLDFAECGLAHRDDEQMTAEKHSPKAITCQCCGKRALSEVTFHTLQVRYDKHGCKDKRPQAKRGPQKATWEIGKDCLANFMSIMQIYHFIHCISHPKGFFAYQGYAMLPTPEGLTLGSSNVKVIHKGYNILRSMLSIPADSSQVTAVNELLFI